MIQKLHYYIDDYLVYLEFKSRDAMLDRKSFQKVYLVLDPHYALFLDLEPFYQMINFDTDDCSLGDLIKEFSQIKTQLLSLEQVATYLIK